MKKDIIQRTVFNEIVTFLNTDNIIEDGVMKKGLIIRHLMLPGEYFSTKSVIEWYAQNLYPKALLSLMFQYIPLKKHMIKETNLPGRFISKNEAGKVMVLTGTLGIDDGFFQDISSEDAWLPDFTKKNPFPPGCASSVWHYKASTLSSPSACPGWTPSPYMRDPRSSGALRPRAAPPAGSLSPAGAPRGFPFPRHHLQ